MNDPSLADDALAACEARVGHRFADRGLLELALTHRSYANEQGRPDHNERLEFLGDAVLGLVTAEWLYRRHPGRPEGELARAKAVLVSAGVLARYAEQLGIGGDLRLGVGESRSGGGGKESLLADGLETLFGAIYLDGGPEAAQRVVVSFLEWADAEAKPERIDAKTELQERIQASGLPLPVYSIVGEDGPEHDKRFTCEVAVDGAAAGRGVGRTKKEAQQLAAAAALSQLDLAAAGERSSG